MGQRVQSKCTPLLVSWQICCWLDKTIVLWLFFVSGEKEVRSSTESEKGEGMLLGSEESRW